MPSFKLQFEFQLAQQDFGAVFPVPALMTEIGAGDGGGRLKGVAASGALAEFGVQ
jgi:hypothetical protein